MINNFLIQQEENNKIAKENEKVKVENNHESEKAFKNNTDQNVPKKKTINPLQSESYIPNDKININDSNKTQDGKLLNNQDSHNIQLSSVKYNSPVSRTVATKKDSDENMAEIDDFDFDDDEESIYITLNILIR